jgi:hypothetical protein
MPQVTLSDIERRIVGNLSIPRSLNDLLHELRQDPTIPVGFTANDLDKLLSGVIDAGWVVNLGEGREHTPGQLAAKVDSHKHAVSMPDEKAKIFEARMADSRRVWRLTGDVFMFTQDGLDKLHEETMPAPPMDQARLESYIAAHARNVLDYPMDGSPFDADGGTLRVDKPLAKGRIVEGMPVATLLPEEYQAWVKQVQTEFESRTGQKLQMPMTGGMPGWSDADENLIIAAENGGTAYGVTAPFYVALTTVAVTDADTGSTITEPTGATGYARKSVANADMGAPSGGSSSNVNAIVGAGISGGTQQTCIGFAKCRAAAAGALVKFGTIPSTIISTTQTPWQFPVGAFTTAAD